MREHRRNVLKDKKKHNSRGATVRGNTVAREEHENNEKVNRNFLNSSAVGYENNNKNEDLLNINQNNNPNSSNYVYN